MNATLIGPVETQLEAIRAVFPDASASARSDGTVLVTVANFPLPPGWNAQSCTISFLAPAGYPMAQPDSFWADAALRLETGATPHATNLTVIPGESEPRLVFSWHLTAGSWNPMRDTLLSYVRTIQDRFARRN